MTELLFLGHAVFYIKSKNVTLLVDPWLENPMVLIIIKYIT